MQCSPLGRNKRKRKTCNFNCTNFFRYHVLFFTIFQLQAGHTDLVKVRDKESETPGEIAKRKGYLRLSKMLSTFETKKDVNKIISVVSNIFFTFHTKILSLPILTESSTNHMFLYGFLRYTKKKKKPNRIYYL